MCVSQPQVELFSPPGDRMWDEELFGPKENCTDFFEEYILSKIDTSLFLALDELDRLFSYEAVSKEFLTLLRSWDEKAKVAKTKSESHNPDSQKAKP